MADTQTAYQSCVSVHIFSGEVVQETTALVDQSDQTSAGRKVSWVFLHVLGEVTDPFCHGRDLKFGTSGVSLVQSVLLTEFRHSLLGFGPCRRKSIIFDTHIAIIVVFQFTNVYNVVICRRGINVVIFFFFIFLVVDRA
jgi:hypothetical protein